MWFRRVAANVWRYVPPSGFVPETYVCSGLIYGTISPLNGAESIRNNQRFADVRKIFVCDIDYEDSIFDDDELEIEDRWYRVKSVESFNNVLPHIEIYLGDSQWERS